MKPHIEELSDPSSESAKLVMSKLFENIGEATKRYSYGFYLLYIFLGFHSLLVNGSLEEVTVFSTKLPKVPEMYWTLSLAESFLFYQGMCALAVERYCQNLFYAYMSKTLPQSAEKGIDILATPPLFMNVERFFIRRSSPAEKNLFSRAFMMLATIWGVLLPPLLITIDIVLNYIRFGSFGGHWVFNMAMGTLSIIVLVRSLYVLYHGERLQEGLHG